VFVPIPTHFDIILENIWQINYQSERIVNVSDGLLLILSLLEIINNKECDMGAKLGVLIIHGVGWQAKGFADAMIKKFGERLSKYGADKTEIKYAKIYWHPILSGREDKLLTDFFPEGKTPHRFSCIRWLRKKVSYCIGDVTGYQYVPNQKDEAHDNIHKVVYDSIVELSKKLDNEDKPVIVIAHSMGSVIISDYIWDRQNWDPEKKEGRQDPYGETPFERMETLAGFITCGSPIPLYAIACDPIVRIKFPPDNLADKLKKNAKWKNFFYFGDVLGWPLRNLGPSYKDTQDIKVNGGFPVFCHTKYWKDDNFIEPVAEYVAGILKVCP
jgi:hypothetical protein